MGDTKKVDSKAKVDPESNGKLLTMEDILNVDDTVFEDIEIPEWGGTVRLQAMTLAERTRYEMAFQRVKEDVGDVDALEHLRANLIARTLVDEKGNNLFNYNKIAELKKLGNRSAAVTERIFDWAMQANALSDTKKKEIVKKSKGDRSTSSE